VCGLLGAARWATGLCARSSGGHRPTPAAPDIGDARSSDRVATNAAPTSSPAQDVAPTPVAEADVPTTPTDTSDTTDTASIASTTLGRDDLPPGPWHWRWVWPTPGRSSGMALVAADGTLVLWSPGGFATPGEPPDGRPTPDVAAALARIPDLSRVAADADLLRSELERTRAVADETRRLLDRAAGAVDDEIDRVHGGDDAGGTGRVAPTGP
jgi:hypothetical protein